MGRLKGDALDDLYAAFSESRAPGWDGYDASSASYDSYLRAERFIETLPANFPAPEVAVDPDGEVSLEWYCPTGRVFSVSIGANDGLTYAGKFSPSRKTHGTEVFTSQIPQVILDNIRREDGLSRAIVYRADVDGIERTYEIRAGQETKFLPDELRPLSTTSSAGNLLWWIIPGALAGMPMPFVHPERRLNSGGPLDSYDDELPALYAAGVRAVVSLLNIPSDAAVYESAGFAFKCLPVADGAAPTIEQAQEFIGFVDRQLADNHPVAVHCEAGLGRTGTMLAVYLVSQGQTAESAIRRVRVAERSAVETASQIDFLERFAAARRAP